MAKMLFSGVAAEIEQKGFITLMEPAAGAGGMVIAAASALLDEGINYQQTLHATLVDIDAAACHMAYTQPPECPGHRDPRQCAGTRQRLGSLGDACPRDGPVGHAFAAPRSRRGSAGRGRPGRGCRSDR